MRPIARFAAPLLAAALLTGCADRILQDAAADAARSVHGVFEVDYAGLFSGKTPDAPEQTLIGSLNGDARADIQNVDLEHMMRASARALEHGRSTETFAWQSTVTGHQGWARAEGAPGADCRKLWTSFQNAAGHTARGLTRACRLADGSWRLAGAHPGDYPDPNTRRLFR